MAEIFSQFFMVISLLMAAIGGATVVDSDGFDFKAKHLEKKQVKLDLRLTMVDACMEDENCEAYGDELPEIRERLTERLANLDACRENRDSCEKKSNRMTHDNMTDEERNDLRSERIANKLELVQSCMANDECDVDANTLSKIESHLLKMEECLESGEDCRKGNHKRHHQRSDRGPAMHRIR